MAVKSLWLSVEELGPGNDDERLMDSGQDEGLPLRFQAQLRQPERSFCEINKLMAAPFQDGALQ